MLTKPTIRQVLLTAVVCTLAISLHAYQAPKPVARIQVPAAFAFCGIQLQVSPGLQKRIQAEVDRLMANTTYYDALAARAAIYMPHVRDAFRYIGAPEDLTYITIQESALRGDAVSASQAVGFWQLKDYTAEEMGLLVGQGIDERRHISRASIAAARYFFKNNLRFDNWLYAVIAYYEGGGGAQPYVRADYFGARQMYVDETLHWYAVKVLAHKFAFEPALATRKPELWLEARSAGAQTSVDKLITESKLPKDQFLQYNLWARGTTLPKGRPHTYYVPNAATGRQSKHTTDPHLAFFEKPAPPIFTFAARAPLTFKPVPSPSKKSASLLPAPATEKTLDPTREPWYNRQFTFAAPGETLQEIAKRTGVPAKKLMKYNDLDADDDLDVGVSILLDKPEKIDVHLITPRQTLESIAARYGKKADKLKKLNRLTASATELMPGRKLYLRVPRPNNEPILIYNLVSAPIANNKPTFAVDSSATPTASVNKVALNQQLAHIGSANPHQANTVTTGNAPPTHSQTLNPQGVNLPSTAIPTSVVGTGSSPQQVVGTGGLGEDKTKQVYAYSQTTNTFSPSSTQTNIQPTVSVAKSGTSAQGAPVNTPVVQKGSVTSAVAVVIPENSAKTVGTMGKSSGEKVGSELKPAIVHKPVWIAGTPYLKYTVKKGETLYAIAKQYGMAMDEIKRVNRLSSYAISVGAVLLVRRPASVK